MEPQMFSKVFLKPFEKAVPMQPLTQFTHVRQWRSPGFANSKIKCETALLSLTIFSGRSPLHFQRL